MAWQLHHGHLNVLFLNTELLQQRKWPLSNNMSSAKEPRLAPWRQPLSVCSLAVEIHCGWQHRLIPSRLCGTPGHRVQTDYINGGSAEGKGQRWCVSKDRAFDEVTEGGAEQTHSPPLSHVAGEVLLKWGLLLVIVHCRDHWFKVTCCPSDYLSWSSN